MSTDPPGYELPLRLFLGFRVLIDELHGELARQGHPEVRPMHGFVFQAIGPDGTFKVNTFEDKEGVPAGEYKVAVSRPPELEETGVWVPLPRRYESIGGSDLTLTVEPKENQVTLELERAERK